MNKQDKKYWHEIVLRIPSPWAEALPSFLEDMGGLGCWLDDSIGEERVKMRAYFPEQTWNNDLHARLEACLKNCQIAFPWTSPDWSLDVHLIEEEDWASKWLPFFKPIQVGPVWIRPSFAQISLAPGEQEIVLDPGQAFGTGNHETTQLCMEAIFRLHGALNDKDDNAHILDLGTGSGILSMFAARLGFTNILALDCDPAAVEVANENVQLNGLVHAIRVEATPISDVQDRFPLLIANLTTEVLRALAPELKKHVAKEGWLVVSGLLATDADALAEEFCASGFNLENKASRNEWACLVLRANRT